MTEVGNFIFRLDNSSTDSKIHNDDTTRAVSNNEGNAGY